MRNLYLFTVKYPYTRYAECFLEDEIIHLAKRFDHIEIVPLQVESAEPKPVPDNCTFCEPLFHNRFVSALHGLFNWRVAKKMLPLLLKNRTLTDRVRQKDWVKAYYTACNLLNAPEVRRIGEKLTKDDVCYFYWGKWSNVLAYFWKEKSHFVSRFHGEGDLWEECHNGYVPLRKEVVGALDAAVFISEKGKRYFMERYSQCRTQFFPLGSNEITLPERTKSNELRVLSCSTVSKLKRVTLIYQSLLAIKDKRIRWMHIGGGPEIDNLKTMVTANEGSNVEVVLTGPVNHEEVLDYYSKHCFDLFVNLSTNEGVPVSIMEAISCDIPVVATNVGGNSEIVTEKTGLLVSANPTPEEVARAIEKIAVEKYEPRQFWQEHYDASKNYAAFADFLSSL